MVAKLARYIRLWLIMARMQVMRLISFRFGFVAYTLGKLFRMGFFIVLVLSVYSSTEEIVGFTKGEMLMFYAMMNAVDVIVQMMFLRGFTHLAGHVKDGTFDAVLTKPVSPLFWTALGRFDFFDFMTLPGVVFFLWYAFQTLGYIPDAVHLATGMLLFVASIAMAFGVLTAMASIVFRTIQNENFWWMYRDLVYVSRNPAEIFPRAIQIIFTFVVPVFVLVTFPARGMLGLLTLWHVAWALAIALVFFVGGIVLWRRGLRVYSSASS